ncbi:MULTISPECIES: ankyrin repeat domain-containing protein [Calothrix]|uniref:Ankyrin repeat domain-containing protein n=2 Tax=Calothrix TaxID=1186 RepID=A0ABR8ACR5_9CYAN|nr:MULTISPECIES: ankyrin repeat domain-containing protein [Calothrix]MBD2197265.1 ankyrin repeat domain-containing protein [Calothrix parietina FACHB-288]MBD2225902.1 ankyrin repeat domain-containing protein [Calothrix anomala FACHB-343]
MSLFSYLFEQKLNEYYESERYEKEPETAYMQAQIEACLSLMSIGFDPNEKHDDNYTILIEIASSCRLDLVKLLVERGADVNAISDDGAFALSEAARFGCQEVFDYLAPLTLSEFREIAYKELPKGLIYRQRKNNYAVEAFVDDAFYGNINAVSTAISQGIDVNAISSNGEAALHKAIRNNQLSIVRILLEAGANPNLKEEDVCGYPPLTIALNSANIDNEIFQELLEAGADINGSSRRGQTVLMLAVLKLNTKAVRQLLELGADFNAKEENDYTALAIAKELSKQGFWDDTKLSEIIQLLESYGAI